MCPVPAAKVAGPPMKAIPASEPAELLTNLAQHHLGLADAQDAPVVLAQVVAGLDLVRGVVNVHRAAPLGAELEAILQLPVEAAARGLMHLVQTHGEGHLTEEQLHGFYVVRHRLEWV